jgi:hypothetical protein
MYLCFSLTCSRLTWVYLVYEFLRCILLLVVLAQRNVERENRPIWMRFLALLVPEGSFWYDFSVTSVSQKPELQQVFLVLISAYDYFSFARCPPAVFLIS